MSRPLIVHTQRWLVRLLLLLTVLSACSEQSDPNELNFWALGREGEVAREMMAEFEAENPGLTVRVQQIPFSAAHEKLLTAHVGNVSPDVAQIGNTWVPEFVALRALEPLSALAMQSQTVSEEGFFAGIWDTNIVGDTLWGIPWYVDTRLMFYRIDLLAEVGRSEPPTTWEEWRLAMREIQQRARDQGDDRRWGAFIPTNEWNLPVMLGLQSGSPLLRENLGRGAFASPEFRRGFEYLVGLYREGLAPTYGSNDVANLYQEFASGRFAFYVSGPWQIGEFRRRMPPAMQNSWATAPMPGPDSSTPGLSLAGGSSLVIFATSERKEAAWKLIEFLSRPEQQVRFYGLTGDLPARLEAWEAPELRDDAITRAFYTQLLRVAPTPKVPEWELIAARIIDQVEAVVRGNVSIDDALVELDRVVDDILEKRRWMQARLAEQAR